MKVVFDTNVLVAAFAAEGLCSKLLRRANRGDFEVCISPFIFQEFQEKLESKLLLSLGEIREAVSILSEVVQMVNPQEKGIKVSGVCKDKDDDLIIACAVACGARYLVTGDKNLLAVKEYQGVMIKSPREFELRLI